MDDLVLARAIHVIAVLFWIGGVGFVTWVVMPALRASERPVERLARFHQIEGRFAWQARIWVTLAEGEHTMTVPLLPEQWGGVYGGQPAALFYEALRNADNVGLVFGSPSGRGHGVYATGPATFTLLSYEVVS